MPFEDMSTSQNVLTLQKSPKLKVVIRKIKRQHTNTNAQTAILYTNKYRAIKSLILNESPKSSESAKYRTVTSFWLMQTNTPVNFLLDRYLAWLCCWSPTFIISSAGVSMEWRKKKAAKFMLLLHTRNVENCVHKIFVASLHGCLWLNHHH